MSPTIAHAGDRGSASSRIALPRPSRVDELPMSAHSKYGAKQRVRQHVFWSFLDSRKFPVKACESGNRRHRQQEAHPQHHPSRQTSHKVRSCWSSAMANCRTSISSSFSQPSCPRHLPPRHEGNACAGLTRNQSARFPFSRFCALAYQAPSGGGGFLFGSLVWSFIWISRRGLSALSRILIFAY